MKRNMYYGRRQPIKGTVFVYQSTTKKFHKQFVVDEGVNSTAPCPLTEPRIPDKKYTKQTRRG